MDNSDEIIVERRDCETPLGLKLILTSSINVILSYCFSLITITVFDTIVIQFNTDPIQIQR